MTRRDDLVRPCPFCGDDMASMGDADHDGYFARSSHDGKLAVNCDGCNALGPFGVGRDGAIKAWNTRALTPADAQAALDASINAAKEEGRVMGLREAAGVADHFRDSCGECNWPEDAVMVGVNVADDIARAILAKIKEAENG